MLDKELVYKLLEKLESKFDAMQEKIDAITEKVVENSAVLEEHQRRSLANEKMVEMLKEEVKPIQRHVIMVDGVLKFIGFMALLLGMGEAIVKILHP